jgi:hypothetical protein
MPLDPLSALSVAASLIQFLDFAVKIVSKGHRIFHSPCGILPENDELETAADRLRALVQVLRRSVALSEQTLGGLCDESTNIAEELIAELERFKVPNGCKNRPWKSLRQALKSVWSKDKLIKLEKRLRAVDEQLKAEILILLRYMTFFSKIFCAS